MSENIYFAEQIERFNQTLHDSVLISDNTIGVEHTGRQNRALFVFAKLITHCMAIAALFEKYETASENHELLDHFSAGVLGRAVVDAALMTMYISEPSLDRDQWDLRRQILFLHDLTNRKRFLSAIKKAAQDQEIAFFENYEDRKVEIRKKIRTLATHLGHPETEVEKFVSGQIVFVSGARGAAREAGWNVDEYEFHQSYLSNWVHSYPVSFLRANEQQISFSKPSDFQFYFFGLVADTCSAFVIDTNSRMKKFVGDIRADPIGQLD